MAPKPAEVGAPVVVGLEGLGRTEEHEAPPCARDHHVEPARVRHEAERSAPVGAHGGDEDELLLPALEAVDGGDLDLGGAEGRREALQLLTDERRLISGRGRGRVEVGRVKAE